MLRDGTVDAVSACWSARLECARQAFSHAGVTVIPHGAAFATYNGVYALRATQTGGLVISVPADEYANVLDAVLGASADDLFDAERLASLFDGRVERVVGPASLSYVDDATFAPAAGAHVRMLDERDRTAVEAMRAACDPEEWEHGDIDFDRNSVCGAFEGAALVSVASWEDRGGLANVGVVTHPAHRGRGHARAAAGAIVEHLLRDGALPQWQTLISNAPSLGVGRALGCIELYRSIAIRLYQRGA
jgi:GNAT superfamily N-acetyltransferase